MKIPTLPEVRKFLGSLVAVAGAIVGFGVPNNVAHIVGIVSAVAASLLVYLAKNAPAPSPVTIPVVVTASPPTTANLGVQPPTDGTAGLAGNDVVWLVVGVLLVIALIIWIAPHIH